MNVIPTGEWFDWSERVFHFPAALEKKDLGLQQKPLG
jgi:hypothetical protein